MKRLTLAEIRRIAERRGLRCLSKKYVNTVTKLHFSCKKSRKHGVFEMRPSSLKYQEAGCPLCAHSRKGQYRKLDIKTVNDFVKAKWNGVCLSTKYLGNNKKLKFKCADGHPFDMTPSAIMNEGSWCRLCRRSFYRSEELVRALFEKRFRVKFPTVKPAWLKNDRGYSMELDGYNEKLKLAFEYHGEHHYQPIKYGGIDPHSRLNQRKKDDERKRKLCRRTGVALIEIPHTIPYGELDKYVVHQCLLKKIRVPNQDRPIDFRGLKLTLPDKLRRLHEHAQSKGGKCFAKNYVSSITKVEWMCAKKHTWWQSYKEVIGNKSRPGTWCPECAKVLKHQTLRDKYGVFPRIKAYARSRGGECTSTHYVNAHAKLTFRCKRDHEWSASANDMLSRQRWCRKCYFIERALKK